MEREEGGNVGRKSGLPLQKMRSQRERILSDCLRKSEVDGNLIAM